MVKTVTFLTCGVYFLVGCTVLRVCPPIEGSVVDAVTGAPIESATVTVVYNTSGWLNPRSERVTQTDSSGHYLFRGKTDVFVWLPMPMDPVSAFSLQVKADGYLASDTMQYGPWLGLEPPSAIPESPNGTPKMVYADEVIVVDPITLSPSPVRTTTQH